MEGKIKKNFIPCKMYKTHYLSSYGHLDLTAILLLWKRVEWFPEYWTYQESRDTDCPLSNRAVGKMLRVQDLSLVFEHWTSTLERGEMSEVLHNAHRCGL